MFYAAAPQTESCCVKKTDSNRKLLVSDGLLCYDENKGGGKMRRVKCYDCGKRYDFDVDDFCPKCGAFTQPPQSARIGADGSVIRVEGINEQNHKNSFVHAELHQENRKRKGTFLEGVTSTLKISPQMGDRLAGHQLAKKRTAGSAMFEVTDFLNDFLG